MGCSLRTLCFLMSWFIFIRRCLTGGQGWAPAHCSPDQIRSDASVHVMRLLKPLSQSMSVYLECSKEKHFSKPPCCILWWLTAWNPDMPLKTLAMSWTRPAPARITYSCVWRHIVHCSLLNPKATDNPLRAASLIWVFFNRVCLTPHIVRVLRCRNDEHL